MTDVHERLAANDHEEIRFLRDAEAGLRGIVAIHDTTLGPAAGGTRRYAFDSEAAAVEDVLRLSRAMTYKYALAGIDMGGAKGVIWTDGNGEPGETDESGEPGETDLEALYRAWGRAVEEFGGRFVTGGDVNTGERELRWMSAETDFVVGLPEQFDHPEGYHGGGLGVLRAMEACCELCYDDRAVGDLHVAVQGAGDMGASLIGYLDERGAQVTVADVDGARVDRMVDEYGAGTVDPDGIYDVECDVFAPCALGGVLDDETIPRLACDAVCGAANNQLADETRHDGALHEAGILYVPDYLANAGRTIDDTDLLRPGGYDHDRARAMIDGIYDRTLRVGRRAAAEDRPTGEIADEIARDRLAAIDSIRSPVRETRRPEW